MTEKAENNEVFWLIELIDKIIDQGPGQLNSTVAAYLTELMRKPKQLNAFVQVSAHSTKSERFARRLYSSLRTAESDVHLRVLPGHQQQSLKDDIAKLNEIFDLPSLSVGSTTWRSNHLTDLKYINRNLTGLRPLYELPNGVSISAIAEAVADLRKKAYNSTQLSDHDKSVLGGCLELMESSVDNLKRGEIGHFRQSIYTAAGRLQLEIVDDGSSKERARAIRDIADDILRVVGLVEVVQTGGGLIGMAGPAGLLGLG